MKRRSVLKMLAALPLVGMACVKAKNIFAREENPYALKPEYCGSQKVDIEYLERIGKWAREHRIPPFRDDDGRLYYVWMPGERRFMTEKEYRWCRVYVSQR